ncbi:hypothetical protein K431DRAFT_324418 [Polychaeton citri CBS 116435]|uniref:Uncharacterized protein n=1 Tax=Polychaeton citri CBS 116435 TaxID=1314669 RepID=A0A9P4UVJ2_9PEZI|nr:hypothetical protein K431DRAFT_324418 [Polychaeton citri CBS 116435]
MRNEASGSNTYRCERHPAAVAGAVEHSSLMMMDVEGCSGPKPPAEAVGCPRGRCAWTAIDTHDMITVLFWVLHARLIRCGQMCVWQTTRSFPSVCPDALPALLALLPTALMLMLMPTLMPVPMQRSKVWRFMPTSPGAAHASKRSLAHTRELEATLHPTPYTLHPSPFTLHPSPYTLHLTTQQSTEQSTAQHSTGNGITTVWLAVAA